MTDFQPEGRKRGRPSNAEIAARKAAEPARVEQTRQRRRRREDLDETTRGLRLHVPASAKDKNYVYRWVNDTAEGRVKRKYEEDWDIVPKTEGLADDARDAGIGTNMERNVGLIGAQPLKGVLMRKRREFHEEDVRLKQERIAATEDELRRAVPTGGRQMDGATSYIPGGRNTIGQN